MQPFRDLLQLVYPPVCFACKQLMTNSGTLHQICDNCLSSCKPVEPAFVQTKILDRLPGTHLDALHIAVQFEHVIQTAIHHIKYQKMNRLAEQIGKWSQKFLLGELSKESIDLVLPVPLHPLRKKERGYNQSYHIAKGIFETLAPPVRTGLLVRARHTPSQTALNREQRQQNVSDAFRVRFPDQVSGNSIVLVDDVVTTGATMDECALTLKSAGATRVVGVALATPVD